MRTRSLLVRLLVPAGLVLLVGVLATLQYHWLGQISAAERDSKQRTLRQHADEFADDFDRELARLYFGLQTTGPAPGADAADAFARRYDTWRETARDPQLVRALYVVDGDAKPATIRQYRAETRTFDQVAWPDALTTIRDRALDPRTRQMLTDDPAHAAMVIREPIVASVPAMIIPMPNLSPSEIVTGRTVFTFGLDNRMLVVHLDREYLQKTFLPELAARHFPERDADHYRFAIVDPDDRAHPIYASGLAAGATIAPAQADATASLFGLRMDLVTHTLARAVTGVAAGGTMKGTFVTRMPQPSAPTVPRLGTNSSSMSIVVESRSQGPGDVLRINARPLSGAWQLLLQHSAGSLDAAVTQTRRRNLWLSFSILAVLAAGVGLVVVNAQRSQKLAAQQMDFVATVSHELRTPLAVIRSAAQNLSAGVVQEPAQARRYGDLIEDEGRRLTEMVEQVLQYAGLSGDRRPPRAHPIDVGAVVREVVAASEAQTQAEGVEIAVEIAHPLPPVLADEDALRRALQNLVANALKYGAEGRWLGLSATRVTARGHDELQIAVRDRGRGIEADDLPHIFEPFYRGRYARDRQIHGNGLGLSLVKRIAEAHGGRVTVKSAPGQGATFTLHLPVAAPDPASRDMSTETTSGVVSVLDS